MPRYAWKTYAAALEASGDVERAYASLLGAAADGHLGALVYLAQMKWMHDRYEEAQSHLAEAERRVPEEDFDTHFALYQAYELGVGDFRTLERFRLTREHLVAAATHHDNPEVKVMVAQRYEYGIQETPRDLAEAERWYALSAASGVPAAVDEYMRFKRRLQGPRK